MPKIINFMLLYALVYERYSLIIYRALTEGEIGAIFISTLLMQYSNPYFLRLAIKI